MKQMERGVNGLSSQVMWKGCKIQVHLVHRWKKAVKVPGELGTWLKR